MIQPRIADLADMMLVGLCTNCAHSSDCTYRTATDKTIIQCELYQLDEDAGMLTSQQGNLCMNCNKANSCQLRGKHIGVWHCEEYE